MMIVSQNREYAVNFDHLENISINRRDDGKYLVQGLIARRSEELYNLGEYDTLDAASAAMNGLLDAYTSYSYTRTDNTDGIPAGIIVPGVVYKMPEV